MSIAEKTLEVLQRYNLSTIEQSKDKLPIILECFESGSLKELGNKTDLPLVFLIKEYDAKDVLPWLPQVADYAHAIGPRDVLVMNQTLVDVAREHDLKIHPWYVRDDFLEHADNAIDENLIYFNKHMDGIFSEFPHTTLQTFNHELERKKQIALEVDLVQEMANAERQFSSPHQTHASDEVDYDELMDHDMDIDYDEEDEDEMFMQ